MLTPLRFAPCFAAVVIAVAACGGGTPPAAAPNAAASPSIGGPCRADADCPLSYSCDKDDPGGECSRKCSTSADCGPGGTCTPEKECLASCRTSADCTRAGYACTGQAPDAYCDIPEAAEKH